MIAASVRTFVVSWKDAADRKESVASDALVIPSMICSPVAGSLPSASQLLVHFVEFQNIYHGAGQEFAVSSFLYTDLLQHLTHNDLDMLIVDLNTLQTVYTLYFLDHVILYGTHVP